MVSLWDLLYQGISNLLEEERTYKTQVAYISVPCFLYLLPQQTFCLQGAFMWWVLSFVSFLTSLTSAMAGDQVKGERAGSSSEKLLQQNSCVDNISVIFLVWCGGDSLPRLHDTADFENGSLWLRRDTPYQQLLSFSTSGWVPNIHTSSCRQSDLIKLR